MGLTTRGPSHPVPGCLRSPAWGVDKWQLSLQLLFPHHRDGHHLEDFGLVFISLQSHPGGSEAAFEADERHFFCQGRKQAGENAACHALALPPSASFAPMKQSLPSSTGLCPSWVSFQPSWCSDWIFLYGACRYHLGLIVTSVGAEALSATGEPSTAGDRVDGEGRVPVGFLPAFQLTYGHQKVSVA